MSPLDNLKTLLQELPEELVEQHRQRMEGEYFDKYPPQTIKRHLQMIARLTSDNLVELAADPGTDQTWTVTIVAFDYMAELSVISGLLVAHGVSILGGDVYTYADPTSSAPGERHPPSPPIPLSPPQRARRRRLRHKQGIQPESTQPPWQQRKIVDIFQVQPLYGETITPADWANLEQELETVLALLKSGQYTQARQQINTRVVDYLRNSPASSSTPLFPVYVSIDNRSSPRYTVVEIRSQDTPAFLYALANALAMRAIYIHKIKIETHQTQVQDTLYLTETEGHKITAPERLRELESAVVLIKQFTHLLTRAPDPGMALSHFNKLLDKILIDLIAQKARNEDIMFLQERKVIAALARLFGTSDFLWEDFIRLQHENLLPVLKDLEALNRRKNRDQMSRELNQQLTRTRSFDKKKERLNRYKDREMFRIDMRQILERITHFDQFSCELADLAEVVVNAAYQICDQRLRQRYGVPQTPGGKPCPLVICALGKCGGGEMGYASDIELLFVYQQQGKTRGPHRIHNSEYFARLVHEISDTIVSKRAGIFEIDLRLRPYGNKGALASSLKSFKDYFHITGGALPYERQALIKLRTIGGDYPLGRQVEAIRDAFVYSQVPLDLKALTHLRQRQNDELVPAGKINAKFSYGGLIDLEYYVQYLQILHGRDNPNLRSPNTMGALENLHQAGWINDSDYQKLRHGYFFLRCLINTLRIVRGNTRDLILPDRTSPEFTFLARRLGYVDREWDKAEAQLERDIGFHMGNAAALYRSRFIERNRSGSDEPVVK